jgi:hypothetical protein
MLTYYRAWIPEQHRARVRPLLEAMNTSDGSSLRLPVEPLPAELNWEGSGPTFAWELNAGLRAGIGKYTGYDVFDQPGWTLEKFAEFVTSRSHLHIVIDRCVRPTLAALAGYLQTPILVDQVLPGGRQALLLSTDGNVTILGYEDGQEDLADLREAFFTQGLEAALAVPGWTLSKSGPPNPYSARDYAFQRRMDLVEWQGAVEDGTVAVPKGAELIPINLMIVGHGDLYGERPAIGRVRTSKHLYEVLVPSLDELAPLEVICAVDGVLQRFVDPVTGEDKGLGAHAGDWADWIARDSIAGGQSSAGKPWEGNGPEARLYRLAHDILSYEDHRADTTYFSTGREVEAWLRRALGNHNAPIAVSVLDDVSFTLAAEGPTLIQKHVFERSGGLQAGYQANAFRPGFRHCRPAWTASTLSPTRRRTAWTTPMWNRTCFRLMRGRTRIPGSLCVSAARLRASRFPPSAPS